MFSNTHGDYSVFEPIYDSISIAYLQSRFIDAVFVCSYEQLATSWIVRRGVHYYSCMYNTDRTWIPASE